MGGDVPLGIWNRWPIPELVQLNFPTLYYKLPNSPLSQSSCFPETTEVTNKFQLKQNRSNFFIFLSGNLSGNSRFPVSRLKSSRLVSWKMIPYSRPKLSDLYPIYGSTSPAFLLEYRYLKLGR